ncbi:MAG: cation:proton antiporter [Candidatus Woesearchaeota archaeon]
MEHELITLGILFFFAIIGGILATKFRQPAVIGLLLVGAIIGPHSLNFVRDEEMISLMAEFGAILLLFVIGLEFVIPKLSKIGFKAMLIAVLKMGIIFFLTYETCIFMDLNNTAALVLGVMLSISSTVVIVKILESKGLYNREEMPLLIGILIVEDVIAVAVLTFLAGAVNNTSILNSIEQLIIAVTILIIAYLIMLIVARIVVSWFISNSGDEGVTFVALGLCAGFSYLAHSLGLSAATGAFLAGSVVASLPQARLFEHAIRPYTLTFTALFFISMGTMVNFQSINENIPFLFVIVTLIVVSRFLAVGFINYLFANFSKDQTIFSSIAFISIGEFSVLIAQQAAPLNLGIDIVSIAAFIVFTTAIIMSLSINHYSKVTDLLESKYPRTYMSKPKSLSKFIKLLFDEIDIENSNTRQFKRLFFRTLLHFNFTLFIIIGWHRAISAINHSASLYATLYIYIVTLIFIVVATGFIYKLVRNTTKLYSSLLVIVSNLDASCDFKRTKNILNNLLIAILLFICALTSPFLTVVFSLPSWTKIIPVVLLLLVILRVNSILRAVQGFHKSREVFPEYRKLSEVYMLKQRTEPTPCPRK